VISIEKKRAQNVAEGGNSNAVRQGLSKTEKKRQEKGLVGEGDP